MTRSPRVSIGMPVYNGAATLADALDSILAQDEPDIEVIISDNASTDRTGEIGRDYAARDPRVSYHRAGRNMGAVWNFNRVFNLSRGEFFMWAAADDTRAPSFVRLCREALLRDPEAVLCYSRTCVVTPGRPVEDVLEKIDLTDRDAPGRLAAMLSADWWWTWGLAFYGLIRSEALRKTRLCENVFGHDYDVVVQLALLGPFVRCGETAFYYSRNPGVEDDSAYYRRVMRSLDPGNRPGPRGLPYMSMAARFLRHAATAPLPIRSRARVAGVMLRHGLLCRRRALEARQLIATATGLRRLRDALRADRSSPRGRVSWPALGGTGGLPTSAFDGAQRTGGQAASATREEGPIDPVAGPRRGDARP